MTRMLQLPDRLEAAGVTVRVLTGWDIPYRAGYVWREPDGEPAGTMHHHVASTKYTPNRDKANGYPGLSYHGSDRLYQERYQGDGYEAVYTVANAYPAPISSGAGDIAVLDKIRTGQEVLGRQGPDTPGWYGNTHYWNNEWVLDGTGSWVDDAVWDMMVVVCQVQNDLMGWTELNHICHAHHTRRKPDLWNGKYSDTNRDGFDKTIIALRADIARQEEDIMKLGDTGDSVAKWQNYLNRWITEYQVPTPVVPETGTFDVATKAKTKTFQEWVKIDQTGQVGAMDTGTMGMLIKVQRLEDQ